MVIVKGWKNNLDAGHIIHMNMEAQYRSYIAKIKSRKHFNRSSNSKSVNKMQTKSMEFGRSQNK